MGVKSMLGMVFKLKSSFKRWENSNITGHNMVGEGMKQGGVIIFGKDGKQKYMYQEITGTVFPIDDIQAAVNAVKEEK